MGTETEKHFVARVVIEKVVKTSKSIHPSQEPTIDREVLELANYTIKDTDIENLKGRLNAVTSIVEDF